MRRVLVVDDDPTIRMLVKALLGPEQYDVLFAEAAEEALDIARADPPDLIVLDVMMPGMDGFAACMELKADVRTAGVPVLLLTARSDFDARAAGEAAKADAYLTKPFSPFQLTRMVEHLLAVKETREG